MSFKSKRNRVFYQLEIKRYLNQTGSPPQVVPAHIESDSRLVVVSSAEDQTHRLEIGQRRTRPYAQVRIHTSRRYIAHGRSGAGSLTEQEYLAAAPALFDLLQKITDARVAEWLHGGPDDPWWGKKSHNYFSRNQKRLVVEESRWTTYDKGIRFTLAVQDRQLAADVCSATLCNKKFVSQIKSLANFIDLRLNKYAQVVRGGKQTRRTRFTKNPLGFKGVKEVQQMIDRRRLPDHAIWELFSFLRVAPGKNKHGILPYLEECYEFDAQSPPSVQRLAANALPNIENRIGSMQLQIVRVNDKLLTFEVFPTDTTHSDSLF